MTTEALETNAGSTEAIQAPETAAPPAAAAPAPAAKESSAPAQGAAETAAPPAYTPNFKFKVLDSEHEVEEMFRPLIKDKDTEAKVKALYEKAYGLDHYKQKHTKLSQDFGTTSKELNSLKEGILNLEGFIANKDFKSFVNALKIPKELVYQFVLDELNYKNLPPEQQKLYDESEAAKQNARMAQAENQRVMGQYQEMLQQAREVELDTLLSSADVSKYAQTFDSNAGKQGAFKEAIANHGYFLFQTTGKDLSAKEVTQDFLRIYGAALTPVAQVAAGATQMASKPADKKPHIPNVTGSGASPTKKIPKSIDDLRAMAKAMED